MIFFKTAFLIKLKQLLLDKGYIAVLLSLPLITGVFVWMSVGHIDEATLKVGIYISEDSKLSQQIRDILIQDEVVHFINYEEEDKLRRAVQTADIECGFVFAEDIDDCLKELDLEDKITMIKSPATSAQGSIREIVTAALYRCIAKDIAYNTLMNKSYAGSQEEMEAFLEKQVESYYEDGELMKVEFVVQGTKETVGTKNQKMSGIISAAKGLAAVFILISSILTGVKLTEERKDELYCRLAVLDKKVILPEIPLSCANALLQTVMGVVTLGIIKWCSKGIMTFNFLQESMMLILYIISVMVIILMLSQFIKSGYVWFSIIPFVTITSIVFCPIVFDISQYNALLGKVSYLLVPYYYLVGEEKLMVLAALMTISIVIYTICLIRKQSV